MCSKKNSRLEEIIREELEAYHDPTQYHKQMENLLKIHEKLLKEFTRQYTYCSACKKYYKIQEEKKVRKTDLRKGVCVYRDCGYGEDDEYADVTYAVTYGVCPLCGYENRELDRYTLKEENKRGRW